MGVSLKNSVVVLSSILFASSSAIAQNLPSQFILHPKQPYTTITKSAGIGTSNANLEAVITRQNAIDWCNNWKPGDASCAAEEEASSSDTFKAAANCHTGEMTDPSGRKVTFDGFITKGDFVGWFAFRDVKTGKKINTSNADGGLVLANQWTSLCPYGAPYNRLPLKTVLDDKSYGLPGDVLAHNNQPMKYVPDLGVIAYIEPKASFIKPRTILFRGSFPSTEGPVQGMAFTFKKGCEPAPYYVEGYYDGGLKLELSGKAPVRAKNGCEIEGYSDKSPNAKLVFHFEPG